MQSSTILLLYLILGAITVIFTISMLLYLFNRKVLRNLNIAIKILIYTSIASIIFAFLEFEILTNEDFTVIYKNIWFLLLVFVVYLFALFIIFAINLNPIKKIQIATRKLSDGAKKITNNIKGSKEFEVIQNNLSKLEKLNNDNEEYKSRLKKEYYKFVPKEFYDYLNKKDVFELTLGSNIQKDVTVLFCDIRNSFKTSESLSLDDNFKFINMYLTVVGENVRKHGGFIDKFLGDGVLAVFLSEESALKASIDISNYFENQNLVSIEDKINFGMGIHSGKVVIAVVGDKERQTPTIISENVNLAHKIESLNKVFSTKALFTKDTLNNLPRDFEINFRYIGTISIDNSVVLPLFENLDCYIGAYKGALIKTKNLFETAVRSFEEKNYKREKNLFIKVLEQNEDDKLCKFYLKKCQKY